jgi:hypothetical protein
LEIFASQGAPTISTTPVANLPPVSLLFLIPVANNGIKIRLLRLIKKSELEGKNVSIQVKSTSQRCPNKIIKAFMIEDFFHLPPCHRGAP